MQTKNRLSWIMARYGIAAVVLGVLVLGSMTGGALASDTVHWGID